MICTCVYCGQAIHYGSLEPGEVARVRSAMMEHDAACSQNPVLARAVRAEALNSECRVVLERLMSAWSPSALGSMSSAPFEALLVKLRGLA